MKKLLRFALLLVACTAFAADDYPARPIQMIVPFPAGGPADIVARLYGQHLSALVGQPVVTLNRDGASGSIGTAAAARAAPDGYTVIFGTTSTMVINPLVMKQVPYVSGSTSRGLEDCAASSPTRRTSSLCATACRRRARPRSWPWRSTRPASTPSPPRA